MPGTIRKLPVTNWRKVGTKSGQHGPYGLGNTRVTMVVTKGRERAISSKSQKSHLSSDCTLQLGCMKLESLVIVDQRATVNTFTGLVHTARQAMGVDFTRNWWANLREAATYSRINDWG